MEFFVIAHAIICLKFNNKTYHLIIVILRFGNYLRGISAYLNIDQKDLSILSPMPSEVQ